METNVAKAEEEKEMLDLNLVSNGASQNCRCKELEDRSKKAEARCAELEFELQNNNNRCEELEIRVRALEGEKYAVENELKDLRIFCEGLKRQSEASSEKEREMRTVVDLTEENGKKQENERKSDEGNLHLDEGNQEKVADLGILGSCCVPPSGEIGDKLSADTPSTDLFQRTPILDSVV